MRTLVIGDIHGAHLALEQVLKRCNYLPEEDTVIQIGDICDGIIHHIYECVEILLSISDLIQIKGNHDDWFIDWLRYGVHPQNWDQGGIATYRSYIQSLNLKNLNPSDIPKSHYDFFMNMHYRYIDDENRLFVHGGFNRNIPMEEQPRSDWMWNRSLFEKALCHTNKETRFRTANNFTEIFIGHTTTLYWNNDKPMHAGNHLIWNVDTGAGSKNGKLTIMDVDTKEYWQSDRIRDLYNL